MLTAFEATLKAVYLYGCAQNGVSEPKAIRNSFQNIEGGRARFQELNIAPFDVLTPDELAQLDLNIQKRHVIGHNLGIMDAKFSDQTGDGKVGETVHLIGEDIRTFAALAKRIVVRLDEWLAPSPS